MNLLKNHRNYEKREKIELDESIITDDYISIRGCSTGFCRTTRAKTISQNEFMELIKEVRKLSKDNKVSLKGINKISKKVEEEYLNYAKEMKEYHKDFDILVVLWEQNIDNLRLGYRDNLIYEEVILPRYFKVQRYYNHTNVNTQFHKLYKRLKETKTKLLIDKKLSSLSIAV